MLKRVIAILAVTVSAAAQQAPAPYAEKVDVNLVMLDAVVTDTRGNQILGLDKDDFVVSENGRPQNIDSVEYFTNRQLLTSPEQNAAFKVERVRGDRYFIIFFDKPPDAQLFDRLVLARKAAENFVDKQMKPNDLVAIVAHDVRLKVLSDFTSDKKQLKRAIDASAKMGRGITSSQSGTAPSILRGIGNDELIENTGTVYEALTSIADAVAPIHARKELILFSAGVVEPGEEIRGDLVVGQSRFYDPMIRTLNRANVAVYPVNLFQDPNQPSYVHQTLQRLATETNGEYFRYNTSFTPALKRIENMTNGYYLVSYYTKRASGDSGYQKVSLALRNPEFKIKARQGYAYGN